MDRDLLRPCIAEMVGTFFLCFIGAGAICTNAVTNGALGLLGIAIAHGLALSIAVTATMNISGGQLNPAVTITLWVCNRMDTARMLLYVAFQLLGGVIAGGFLVLVFNNSDIVFSREVGLGTPHISDMLKTTNPEAWWGRYHVPVTAIVIEMVLSFLLLYAVFGTAVDPRAPKVGGFGIGLMVCADILMGGPLVGAAMNPARAFGPGLWEAGVMGFDRMWDQFVYWAGPILGGSLAGLVYTKFILPEEKTP
jgi:MIP family channel proteins